MVQAALRGWGEQAFAALFGSGTGRDFYSDCFRRGLEHGNAHGAAMTYHNLGAIAQERCDFAAAEQWYRQALAISEQHGNAHGAARTYHQLGKLAGLQNHFLESGRWLVRAIAGLVSQNDPHNAETCVNNFMSTYRQAPPTDQAQLRNIWDEAGLGVFPERSDAATEDAEPEG